MFLSSADDGITLDTNVNVVFLNFDDDYTVNLQSPSVMVGKEVYFRSRSVNGHTVTISEIYGNDYEFSSGYVHFRVISDGIEWTISDWYSDD